MSRGASAAEKAGPMRKSRANAPAKRVSGRGAAVQATRKRSSARARRDRDETITLDELMRRLADPDVPDEEIRPYLTATRAGLTPLLLPNERVDQRAPEARARGDIGLGFLNAVYRARRRRRFEQRLADKDQSPVLLAEGDSWFQYPVFLKDVIDHLAADHTIFCLSGAGDELRTMVANPEYRDYLDHLAGGKGIAFSAFLFSAGCNDVVAEHMRAFLKPYDAAQPAAWHLHPEKFAGKLADIVAGYEMVIATIREVQPVVPILIHGYDYAVPLPEQEPCTPPSDGWLGAPMRAVGIPDGDLQAEIIREMIDRINGALLSLAAGNADGRHAAVYFVDNRTVVGGRWADELHPTDEGFRAVSDNFRRVLRAACG